MLPAGANAYQH